MTREEARFILKSIRPDSADLEDPVFSEAMALLESDLELQAWFAREQAFDRAMHHSLEHIQPPESLKMEILVGMNANRVKSRESTPEKTVDFESGNPASGSKNVAWTRWLPLAAAAMVLFLIGTQIPGFLNPGAPTPGAEAGESVPPFLAFLTETYDSPEFGLEKVSDNLDELQAHLASRNAPTANLPGQLIELNPVGCLKLEYDSIPIGLVCMRDGEFVYHIFSVNQQFLADLMPGMRPDDMPATFSDGENAFKVWTDGQNLNILMGKTDVDKLTSYY